MKDPNVLRNNLSNYTGTEEWHKHSLNPNTLYTDGVQYFAENAGNGAYWLLDIFATELYQLQKEDGFLHIELIVKDAKATLLADDGNGNPLYSRDIEFTDCPPGIWEFYFTDDVILLPSEY